MSFNEHYQVCFKSTKNFVNFVKLNTEDQREFDDDEIPWLLQRVAQNMLLYPNNIATAKSDYITLLGVLMKKGIIFSEFKDLKASRNYPD